MSQIDHTSALV